MNINDIFNIAIQKAVKNLGLQYPFDSFEKEVKIFLKKDKNEDWRSRDDHKFYKLWEEKGTYIHTHRHRGELFLLKEAKPHDGFPYFFTEFICTNDKIKKGVRFLESEDSRLLKAPLDEWQSFILEAYHKKPDLLKF